MMYGWYDGSDWAMMAVNIVFLVVVVGAVVFGVVFYSRRSGQQHSPDSGGGSSSRARSILEERFARGEIDEAEFHERSDALQR